MSKWVVDIHGEIEGDYELIEKYEESNTDAISRQAVLEYIEGSEAELGHSSENELVCQDIKKMPPVIPQQNKEVLNKIKEEINTKSRMHMDGDLYIKVSECMQIIDKYSEGEIKT